MVSNDGRAKMKNSWRQHGHDTHEAECAEVGGGGYDMYTDTQGEWCLKRKRG